MNGMVILTAAAACVFAYAVFIYRKASQVLKSSEKMIDAAVDGVFSEHEFSEERLSKVEAKFYRYLSEHDVQKRQMEAERKNMKQLVADISHQTQTPLANILMYTQLLAESENIGEAERKMAEKTAEQSEKLSFLISSLVKTSRLETGMISLYPRHDNVLSLLAEVYESFAAKAAAKHRYLILDTGEKQFEQTEEQTEEQAEENAIFAYFDRKWTAEAIGNLTDNAIKYTEDGGSIRLSVTEYELFVRIDVQDNGIGIAEKEQAQVFGRFYRSQSVADRQGVGIGLYLAREIITKEGGYIKLSSKEGGGSLFSVFLPRTEAARPTGSTENLSAL